MNPASNRLNPSHWTEPSLSPVERAQLLVGEMTLEEKLQQIGSTWPGSEHLDEAVAPLQDQHRLATPFEEAIRDGIGHLTRPFGTAPVDSMEGMARLADLQHRVRAANRFGIPALAHEECLTGLTAWKATVFPTPLAWAATFDHELVNRMGTAIGHDMAALGVHQGLAPVLDVVRDYRWGRVEETLGEDPYLVSEMASAYVTGLQSSGIIATLKHFVGYSASHGARNHAPVSIGARELRDVMLIPFEKAVVKAGARSVMNSYTELDGVPTASDRELLTGLLREAWGFTGSVVSDYWAISFLSSMHRLTDDVTTAGVLALTAGIDVELPHTLAYSPDLAGHEIGDALDRAATIVLTQKAELGLLDARWAPPTPTDVDLDSADNREIATLLAEESVVLLQNRSELLPLRAAPLRVAVIGPVADDPRCLFGCYSFPNHVLPNFPDRPLGIAAPTILDAIRTELPDAEIVHEPGVDVRAGGRTGIPAAVDLARNSDLTVLLVGDRSGMFGHGTSGEGCDVVDLTLPGEQDALAAAVLEAAERSVLAVVSGRPYAVGHLVAKSDAALQVFLPGQAGGAAIAGVISGRISPSGRLPVQLPGTASTQPGTYLAPPLALRTEGISNLDPTPAFPFGFGLSYTSFEISDVILSADEIPTDGQVTLRATIRNRGPRPGTCVPQLYLSDPEAEVTRPVRQLIGYARATIEPGESVDVAFTVHADLSSYTGRDLRRRVEPGRITLTIGFDAADEGRAFDVLLRGPVRLVDHHRSMSSEVVVHHEDPRAGRPAA
ncbi:beta-glucosidase [Agromyces sp. SYSU T0242]|uniref:beta-glucosidase n=1 Tax=Agromyces litoreus TaxID=3158561 RepID=UPI00339269BA